VKLTVVGCSGSISGPRSPASCYLVQARHADGDFSLVLDLGPGALGALYHHLEPSRIGAVGLSHLHADHCLDLCGLYVALAYAPGGPRPKISVYGPQGTLPRLARAYHAPPPITPGVEPEATRFEERFDFHDWAAEQVIGPFAVRTAPVSHPTPAYAVRVTEISTGATLVYSGDTGPGPALVDLARGADLLLAEAAFLDRPDNAPNLHLSGPQAARVAADAGVGRLMLTHIPPWHDPQQVLAEARPHYAGPLDLATSGAQWVIEAGGARPLL
jgi:ribonuclease BN (tRNA processing enzyme)